MSTEQKSNLEDERGMNRLEAFSDGVLAVAITLLVLNIAVPSPDAKGTLPLVTLWKLWPNYLGYVTSFLVIGIFWINHHQLFLYVKRTDQGLLFLNTLFLLCVGLIPFVTALVAGYLQKPGEYTAIIIYSGLLLLVSIMFSGLWWYVATHLRLVDPHVDPRILWHMLRRSCMSIPFYLLSIALSLISVEASLVLYILIAIFYALPIERFLKRRRMRDEQNPLPRTNDLP